MAPGPPRARSSILANNDAVSAVRDTRTGALGITFWRAGAIEGIQSNAPAVVYVTMTDANTMRVDAADPERQRDRHHSADHPRQLAHDERGLLAHRPDRSRSLFRAKAAKRRP